MLDDEQRKVQRVLPNVPITPHLGRHTARGRSSSTGSPRALRKTKKALTKPEVLAVSNRLNSLQTQLADPQGHRPDEGPARSAARRR